VGGGDLVCHRLAEWVKVSVTTQRSVALRFCYSYHFQLPGKDLKGGERQPMPSLRRKLIIIIIIIIICN
jgi:hypothetical protein